MKISQLCSIKLSGAALKLSWLDVVGSKQKNSPDSKHTRFQATLFKHSLGLTSSFITDGSSPTITAAFTTCPCTAAPLPLAWWESSASAPPWAWISADKGSTQSQLPPVSVASHICSLLRGADMPTKACRPEVQTTKWWWWWGGRGSYIPNIHLPSFWYLSVHRYLSQICLKVTGMTVR